jgi:hypothetical protein
LGELPLKKEEVDLIAANEVEGVPIVGDTDDNMDEDYVPSESEVSENESVEDMTEDERRLLIRDMLAQVRGIQKKKKQKKVKSTGANVRLPARGKEGDTVA